MEDVLSQYALPYDPLCPLICFDERPCFLIEDIGGILPMSAGKAKRYHYEYGKNGSCCVFLAFDPHRKMRYVEVRERRTAVDYAQFMHHLVKRYYPKVEKIRLVQDNLNTHTPGAFYEVFPADEAFELGNCFSWHYTPKKGSWLNMAESEFVGFGQTMFIPPHTQCRGDAKRGVGLGCSSESAASGCYVDLCESGCA